MRDEVGIRGAKEGMWSMTNDPLAVSHDTVKVILAKNLFVARNALGLTQADLAQAAGVSRATIANLEGGEADPRLSTITNVAIALGTSPILLLLGENESRALANVTQALPRDLVTKDDAERMRRFASLGLQKHNVQAAMLGANAARKAGLSVAGAAIGSTLALGAMGVAIGAVLGITGGKDKGEDSETPE